MGWPWIKHLLETKTSRTRRKRSCNCLKDCRWAYAMVCRHLLMVVHWLQQWCLGTSLAFVSIVWWPVTIIATVKVQVDEITSMSRIYSSKLYYLYAKLFSHLINTTWKYLDRFVSVSDFSLALFQTIFEADTFFTDPLYTYTNVKFL